MTITITPDPVGITFVVLAGHIGIAIKPDPVAISFAVPAPAVVQGNLTIRPDPVSISFALKTPFVTGGTQIAIVVPTSRQRARVFIYEPGWPRNEILELTRAFNIDRSFERMGPGHAAFTVPRNDLQLVGQVLERGNLVVVLGDDTPPWVGTLVDASASHKDGSITVAGQGVASILDGRIVAQDKHVIGSVGSHQIFRQIITEANARNDTSIRLPVVLAPGPELDEFQSGSESVLQALGELHDRTDYEWWIDSIVDSKHIYNTIYWGRFQGFDLSDTMHLWQNVHFTDVKYKVDLSKIMATVQVLGDFGAMLPLRNSVMRTVQKAPQATQSAARVEAASLAATIALGDLPSGIRNESVTYEVMTGSISEMARRARRGLERPLNATEQITLTLNRRVDWRNIRVGNFLTAHFTVQEDRPLSRIVRVVGYQPDEEKGEIEIVCEVPITR